MRGLIAREEEKIGSDDRRVSKQLSKQKPNSEKY